MFFAILTGVIIPSEDCTSLTFPVRSIIGMSPNPSGICGIVLSFYMLFSALYIAIEKLVFLEFVRINPKFGAALRAINPYTLTVARIGLSIIIEAFQRTKYTFPLFSESMHPEILFTMETGHFNLGIFM